MNEHPIVALAGEQEWLQPVQEKGEALVKGAFESAGDAGQTVKNALHGTWLGHPLHAAITDVPIGSWTAAAVLDLLDAGGHREYRAGADAAVAVGLVGAVGAAVTGLTDWSDLQGKPQRVGALHGLINTTGAILYTTSYLCRKTGNRAAGRAFGFCGFAFVLAGAFLGGELAYGQRIGVNHAPDPDDELPADYTRVCAVWDLTDAEPTKQSIGCTDIFLLKRGEAIYALANKCSHLGGPLSEGKMVGNSIQCPWHGSRFCVKDGSVVDGPATHPLPVLDVQLREGQVYVRAQRT